MNALSVIKQACADAIEESDDEIPSWRAAYVSIVDPASVLEMADIIETLLDRIEAAGEKGLVEDIRRRIADV